MNQAIIFTDREEWDPIRHGVVCMAQVNGFQVYCCVAAQTLNDRYGTAAEPEQYIALFRQHRWDLDDELEQAILDEAFEDDGWVVI
ncbi:hypothetical protein SOASR032_31890 [Pragia fontium]|uniref:DUF1488 domain-containing protein n=1 Tax=Pragia fontium TaxID=82985 RepID=A0ABQ5LLW1_9GAMM|nr:DUF1488 domain-containing protein [Pragia fontium]GKX64620.1 hypothetical protein SOASR032_31890 [Pragia fontium]